MGRNTTKLNEEVVTLTENVAEVVEKEEVKTEEKNATEDLIALISKLQTEITELKASQINNSTQQIIIQKETTMNGKKVKCINITNNEINVSTDRDGAGKTFTFKQFGDYKMIKFDDLSDIVSSYPYTMGHGLVYISDKEVVEELGLSDEYLTIYTPEMIGELVYLRRNGDVDLLLGMEENLLKSTVKTIANLFNANERFDYNDLKKIKDKSGYDIEELAKELKLADLSVEREEKEKLI